MSTQTQVEIGSDFLGYRIEELVGRGGMGVVYRAYDLRLKRTVALKLVTPELALDERFKERFARETELTMALEHPNVVPIHDAGDVDGRLYLAMRLVEGTDLRALLATEGALEPARALAICGQVANALDAAHRKGLVHRDVKPSNVLLDANEHVYLVDFGLTRRLEEQGAQAGEGRSVGTPAYLAPEQIEGTAVDGRADVYSLGCVLFECLTGSVPYRRASRLAAAWAHLEEEPPRASELGAELTTAIDAVLQRALAKEPEDRYPTCGALIEAAEQALGLRQRPIVRRRSVLLLVAATSAVVLSAALALTLVAHEDGAKTVPIVRENSLVRIDPETNAISAVTDVGLGPMAAAVGGSSVWVYNDVDGTVSEIDAGTTDVRHTTDLPARPVDLGLLTGPVLAADEGGAWIVGVDDRGRSVLTRVLSGGRGAHRADVGAAFLDAAEGSILLARGAAAEAVPILASVGREASARGFRLVAWRARTVEAEALAQAGSRQEAEGQLAAVVAEADTAGAVLVRDSACATAKRLGLGVPEPAQPAPSGDADGAEPELVGTGERLVTSMFADVRGYTALASATPPADLADRMETLHRWAAAEVRRQGGLVDKFAGDAVMATFNATGTRLDHARQALEAALALTGKAAFLDLGIGIGIAVGPAVVGRTVAGGNVSVLGTTTNLAARLQSAAAAGEIVLSDEAHRRVIDWLAQRGLEAVPEALELKGFDAPQPAWRLGASATL